MRVIPSEEYNTRNVEPVQKPTSSDSEQDNTQKETKETKVDKGCSHLFSLIMQRVGIYIVMCCDSNAKGLAGYTAIYGQCKCQAVDSMWEYKHCIFDSGQTCSIDAIDKIEPCTFTCVKDFEMNLLDTIHDVLKECECPYTQKVLKEIGIGCIKNIRLLNAAIKLEEMKSDPISTSNALMSYVKNNV